MPIVSLDVERSGLWKERLQGPARLVVVAVVLSLFDSVGKSHEGDACDSVGWWNVLIGDGDSISFWRRQWGSVWARRLCKTSYGLGEDNKDDRLS